MPSQPLADKIRPKSIDEIVGQQHLVGKNGSIRNMLAQNYVTNMIFFGPPGTGKTTLANIIASGTNMSFYKLNATSASISDIKDVILKAESMFGSQGTLLYIDEIQYFNKKQQQTLLEYIEDGRITLIASTTENPYMYIYNSIISRSAVFEFKPVSSSDIALALNRAIQILCEETGKKCETDTAVISNLAARCCGDVRRAVNLLENLFYMTNGNIKEENLDMMIPKVMGNFDKDGTAHYDLLSALQKSIRGSDPDAAIFYLAKLLEGGDLISPCRRLGIIACEDVGLAFPSAPSITKACIDIAMSVGLPEAVIPLSHAVIVLATAPKSNAAYLAYSGAKEAIAAGKGQHIPDHMRPVNEFENYKYPHDFPDHWVKQQYLPDDLLGSVFYRFGENKTEQAAKQYWEKIKNK